MFGIPGGRSGRKRRPATLLVDDGDGVLSTEFGNPSLLLFTSVASAVNYLEVTNAATGNAPKLSYAGNSTGPFLVLNPTSGGIDLASINNGTSGARTGLSAISQAADKSAYIEADAEGGTRYFYMEQGGSTYTNPGAVFAASNDVEIRAGEVGDGDITFKPADGAGNSLTSLLLTSVASAVNYLEITNAATGNAPTISSAGSGSVVTFGLGDNTQLDATDTPFKVSSTVVGGYHVIETIDNGAFGPYWVTYHDTTTPAVDDFVGGFTFYGNDSTTNEVIYGGIDVQITDPTHATRGSKFSFSAGANVYQLVLSNGASIGSSDLNPGLGNLESSGTIKAGKRLTSGVVALTDGATPALDASLGNLFVLTAAGDRTIAVPSNATSGQKIIIRHEASGGARTLALNTGAGGFRYGSDITGLTATTSGKSDYIGCVYDATDSFWDVVSYVKGF